MLNPLGRNWGSQVNWDDLAKFFAAFAISWTIILYAGVGWLIYHQTLPSIRMRNIPLAVASTSFLHVYLVKIVLAYTTNGNFSCAAEFWIMSIYLPFGIALFQANMVQLLSISTQQRKLLQGDRSSTLRPVHPKGISGVWSRWRALSPLKQAYVLIGIGMAIQVIITAVLYATNTKLQGQWGNIARPAGHIKCRKGPEWIPSAFWQLFWSAVYGPYLVFKLRNVRDTHYWRMQVIVSVITGIPGTPLWLAAVFSPAFKPINKYWVPPMWLAPGIIIMQTLTVFVPIYDALTAGRLSPATISAIREWENRDATQSRSTLTHKSVMTQDTSTTQNTTKSDQSRTFQMAALEQELASDPASLLHFAATRDFTAENIIFLIAVRDWKEKCKTHGCGAMFEQAVEIYAHSVSEKMAEFPINIEGVIRSRLDTLFAPAVSNVRARQRDPYNEVTPFAGPAVPLSPLKSTSESRTINKEMYDEGHEGVDEKVFDAAEKSIKYLVLTNTWRKFITEGSPRASMETW